MNDPGTERLYFHRGSFGPGWLVELRSDGLYHCECFIDTHIQKEERVEATPERWAVFWAVIDRDGVWEWRRRYENVDICDGSWWTLKLRHGRRCLSSKGLNAFPDSDGPEYSSKGPFASFLVALRQLVGGRPLK